MEFSLGGESQSGLIVQILLWREYKSREYPRLAVKILEHVSKKRTWYQSGDGYYSSESSVIGLSLMSIFYYQEYKGINEDLQLKLRDILKNATSLPMLVNYLSFYNLYLRSTDSSVVNPDREFPIITLVDYKTHISTFLKTLISIANSPAENLEDILYFRYETAFLNNADFIPLLDQIISSGSVDEIDTEFVLFSETDPLTNRFFQRRNELILLDDSLYFSQTFDQVLARWFDLTLSRINFSTYGVENTLRSIEGYLPKICPVIDGTNTLNRLEELISQAKEKSSSKESSAEAYLYYLQQIYNHCRKQ